MNQENSVSDPCFTYFQESIDSYRLPEKFTYPFFYEPHPLCLLATRLLQKQIKNQTDWVHDFGIDRHVDGVNIGKMFGVLLVENKLQEIGFLSAFSGKLAEKHNWPGFVPPIVDYLGKNSFFRKGEIEIAQISETVNLLETAPEYLELKKKLKQEADLASKEISEQKTIAKRSKEGSENKTTGS